MQGSEDLQRFLDDESYEAVSEGLLIGGLYNRGKECTSQIQHKGLYIFCVQKERDIFIFFLFNIKYFMFVMTDNYYFK